MRKVDPDWEDRFIIIFVYYTTVHEISTSRKTKR